ncbi:exodeoxyribonuclease VII small subunit [Desulfuromonas soudanensis]|uniref:Exodeoxyribonuclease 7 small subunit n=1 Tax=Desulfuromonas soudanensis TaxID=1603606 RepID=A0A0M4DJB3_9BACT|nr:exodeoxyribonuclease VII small subunit [Desulfuromonas soudanensis]ALC17157.1 exodeoxyribonuclease VII small subunit [Desulfuromonas soudanensis]
MAKKESFEIVLRDLEDAVARLESGELSLEESLTCFERGVKSAASCQKLLKGVEFRVEQLLKDQDGRLHEEPLDGV